MNGRDVEYLFSRRAVLRNAKTVSLPPLFHGFSCFADPFDPFSVEKTSSLPRDVYCGNLDYAVLVSSVFSYSSMDLKSSLKLPLPKPPQPAACSFLCPSGVMSQPMR